MFRERQNKDTVYCNFDKLLSFAIIIVVMIHLSSDDMPSILLAALRSPHSYDQR